MIGRNGSPGFALAAAVFALVLIAALLAGVFFAAEQELRLGRNSLGAERAFAAAEAGLGAALAGWREARYNSLLPGHSATFAGDLPARTGAYTGTVTRLGGPLFLVQATGRDEAGSARRAVGQVVRLNPPLLDLNAALTVADRLDLAPASLVSGDDQSPQGWICPAAAASIGVRIADASRISVASCPLNACVMGSPAIMGDSTVGDSLDRRADDAAWNELAAAASRTYAPGSDLAAAIGPSGTGLTCDSSARDNWGDPSVPPAVQGCADYFPVTLAAGDLHIRGGSGQGILLVHGDLVIEGGFQFRGALLVRGTLTLLGLGGRLLGGVEASRVDLRPSGPMGSAEVRYSSCVVRTVLLRSASAVPLASRGWVELF
jgi:hypothetical protein